jgi:hypothetical protein
MLMLTAGVLMILAGAAEERTVAVIQASDSPIRLEHAVVLSASDGPPVLLYAATNLTNDPFDQFTVMAFIFRADGNLKARQLAPGRRTLDAHETKYSTMVLDGSPIERGDSIVVGVNQAQRDDKSDTWWRTELQPLAEAVVRRKP